jgi:hypothetical protein
MYGFRIIGISSYKKISMFFLPAWEFVLEFVQELSKKTGETYSEKQLYQAKLNLSKNGGFYCLWEKDGHSYLLEDVSRITRNIPETDQVVDFEFQKEFVEKLYREKMAWETARVVGRSQDWYKTWSVDDLKCRLEVFCTIENMPDFKEYMNNGKRPREDGTQERGTQERGTQNLHGTQEHATREHATQEERLTESIEKSEIDELCKKMKKLKTKKKSVAFSNSQDLHEEEIPDENVEEKMPENLEKVIYDAITNTCKKDGYATMVMIRKYTRENVEHKNAKKLDAYVSEKVRECVENGTLSRGSNKISYCLT